MRLTENQHVSYETARERALLLLAEQNYPVCASHVGGAIWPENNMRAQGLGFAAAGILKRMERQGLVHWTYHEYPNGERKWGYKISRKGLRAQAMLMPPPPEETRA